jgi:hypothetical protein
MARQRRPDEPSSYQPQPEIPTELRQRFDVIRAVMGDRMTITRAAQELGIARVNMQTLVHRVEAAIVAALQPKTTGPTPKPTAQAELEAKVKQLTKENEKLNTQLQAADEMMMAAGEIIRSLRGLPPESSRTSSPRSKRPRTQASDEDPERATRRTVLSRVLTRLRTTRDARHARMLGLDGKTLRRWLGRLIAGEPLRERRGGKRRSGPPASESRVRELVETLHGLAGAASLAHSVDGVSRRRAAEIKAEVLTANERERKQASARVIVTRPGVIRGFDAMHVSDGVALIASDSCVPYRTTSRHVPAYDARNVADVLDEDFENHGAPLVLREDRARCHTAEPVMSVLRKHAVLLLQGPPYLARYYGQHERQNREHRAWCAWDGDRALVDQRGLDEMKNALNDLWRRPRLGWRTATQCWEERGPLEEDREALRIDVELRAQRLRENHVVSDVAMRLAIEQALTVRGYLRVIPGTKGAM